MHLPSCFTGGIVKAKGERNCSPLRKSFTIFLIFYLRLSFDATNTSGKDAAVKEIEKVVRPKTHHRDVLSSSFSLDS